MCVGINVPGVVCRSCGLFSACSVVPLQLEGIHDPLVVRLCGHVETAETVCEIPDLVIMVNADTGNYVSVAVVPDVVAIQIVGVV